MHASSLGGHPDDAVAERLLACGRNGEPQFGGMTGFSVPCAAEGQAFRFMNALRMVVPNPESGRCAFACNASGYLDPPQARSETPSAAGHPEHLGLPLRGYRRPSRYRPRSRSGMGVLGPRLRRTVLWRHIPVRPPIVVRQRVEHSLPSPPVPPGVSVRAMPWLLGSAPSCTAPTCRRVPELAARKLVVTSGRRGVHAHRQNVRVVKLLVAHRRCEMT